MIMSKTIHFSLIKRDVISKNKRYGNYSVL